MTEHPAIEALRRCRMDLTAAQARITDALNELKASSFKTPSPDPVAALKREIENGAIRDDIDLEVAVRALLDQSIYLDTMAIGELLNSLDEHRPSGAVAK